MKNSCLLFILSFLSAVLCFGCSKKKDSDIVNDTTAIDIMSHVMSTAALTEPYICFTDLDDNCRRQLTGLYNIDEALIDTITDIAIIRSEGISSDEYIVVRTPEAASIEAALKKYIEKRLGDFTGYAPAEAEKLEKAVLLSEADYTALFVGSMTDVCKSAFEDCIKTDFSLTDRDLAAKSDIIEYAANNSAASESSAQNDSTETVLIDDIPGLIETYDTSMILKAYKTKDADILTDVKDLKVLNECKRIIKSEITEDMTDFQKEFAIHNYIVEHTDYDQNALVYSDKYTEYADQPYGTLINKVAICLGYTTTFKLLMDMLDIECIIVKGSAYDYNANHAWNLVKLDGEWYAVDLTWDDPVNSNKISHKYFNVKDKFLLDNQHHWNRDEYPAATGERYSYK